MTDLFYIYHLFSYEYKCNAHFGPKGLSQIIFIDIQWILSLYYILLRGKMISEPLRVAF